MVRFPAHRLPYREQDALWLAFCMVLSKLHTHQNIYRFLKDLMNRQERIMFVRRLQVAKRLFQEKTYEEIQKELKVGPDTIGRVHRGLRFGRDGYMDAIKQLISIEKRTRRRQT